MFSSIRVDKNTEGLEVSRSVDKFLLNLQKSTKRVPKYLQPVPKQNHSIIKSQQFQHKEYDTYLFQFSFQIFFFLLEFRYLSCQFLKTKGKEKRKVNYPFRTDGRSNIHTLDVYASPQKCINRAKQFHLLYYIIV